MGDFNRGPRRSFNRGGEGGFRRNFGPREMHKAVCSKCGENCEVPFKPTEGRPVYCKDCFMNQKRDGFGSRDNREESNEAEQKPKKGSSKKEAEESSEDKPEEESEEAEEENSEESSEDF